MNKIEKEFMIASLRKQRDLLNGLVSQIKQKEELDKGTRLLYDQVTKQVEENLKQLKKLRKDCFECQDSYQFHFDLHSNKTSNRSGRN